jgi:hypothetical protein
MSIRNLSIAALLASMCLSSTAQAQGYTTGAIQGVVRDQASGEGLAGVTVVITSPALQGTQSAITEGSGQYKITNLPPGTYSATYYYSDITVRRNNILVSINKTTPAYVKLNTNQAGGEVIVIDDKAPSIDPTSTTQGVTLDQDYTRNIPIPGRTFASALGAAAGSAGDDLGVSFSGSTSLENSYVVDGVNTTGLTYGTVGSPLINDFIEEIEIITGGYNAEHGRATGGVVNVVTKSGSNEFHGTIFSYVSPGFLIATRDRNPTESASIDVESNMAYNMDFGFDLGGPIVKDKVWFYVGFAPRLARLDVDKVTKSRTDCRQLQADGNLSDCVPASADGPGFADGLADTDPDSGFLIFDELDRKRLNAQQTTYQFVSKINYALAPEHQGQVSLIGTPVSGESVGVTGDPSATTYDYNELTTDVATKWTSKFNNNKTEVEAVLGWHRSSWEADSIDNNANSIPRQNLYYGDLATWGRLGFESAATIAGCTDSGDPGGSDPYPYLARNCPDEGVGYRIGGPGGIADEKEERRSARVSVTQRVKAIGNHEVKAGMDVEDNLYHNVRNISGGVYYDVLLGGYNQTDATRWVQLAPPGSPEGFDNLCRNDTIRGKEEFACQWLGPNDVIGKTLNWSGYLRDSWQPMPNLTLNYGLRYEEQRLRYAEDLQGTADPFTGNMRNKNAMVIKNMWAPRVGALYDWTKEGRSKVYGHWGRFYESIPMDINNRSFGGETYYSQVFDSSTQCGDTVDGIGGPSGPGCTEGDTVGTTVASYSETLFGSGVLVAPGIRGQYLDEYILGVEYEVLEDLKLGISFKNRRLGRVLEDVSVDQADTYILANPGDWSSDEENKLISEIEDLENSGGDPLAISRLKANLAQFQGIRTFDKPRRDYNAVEMTATKRFSRQFFIQASYTYSRAEGNFPGLYSADNGQVDPNISSQFDLIELLANRDGPLPQDRPHYIKFDGYYTVDFKKAGELTLGTRFRALSGTPVNALAKHYLYGYDESFLLPRAEMGRTDFNYGLDLHAGFSRQLGKGMSLEVFGDLFNVLNRQGQGDVSATYTLDPANPIVGGEYSDLIFAKMQNENGLETSDPVGRWRNFLNTTSRYGPLRARLGARLTF